MKYSREKASKVMRVVSILGVICLLALQWVWWRNAYRAVEMDFMSKAEECVGSSIDNLIMNQMNFKSSDFSFNQLGPGVKVDTIINMAKAGKLGNSVMVFPKHKAKNSRTLQYSIEEALNITNNPLTELMIDSAFKSDFNSKYGFKPQTTIEINRLSNEIDSIHQPVFNRVSIGKGHDTIFHQFGYKSYVTIIIQSPINFYIKKGAAILLVSILLVVLIGGILIFQFINMQRERKFSEFLIDYTRMITHDLKSPVSGLQMIFGWLRKDWSDQPAKRDKYLVDGMTLSNKIMLNLDNILYTAVSEHRELKVRLNDTPIGKFMERVVDSYRIRSYFPKNIVYKTYYEPEHFRCSMDMSLMENVMYNLIDNAIKFTPMETLIEIFCSKVGNEVVIRVKDNGMGIPADEQKRIFDLFEQGYTNQSSQFPGFGIGLHFVELVLRAHDGKVSVQSEVGKGTEFILRFISKEYS